ncbi:SGNH/GDSL hydrolase family protein [Aeromicrobium sp. UC242_57]|uniref:SGNH/GDSL hydrolase family protein n=1 Tax=Aeromicrobium sp. UC242_57 TaxID=3374624 RepID=UPI0037B8BAB3
MTRPRITRRSPIAVALALVLAVGPYLLWQGAAQGGPTHGVSMIAPRGIVVVGDSITARYNDSPGDPDQAWWSFAGRALDAEVTTYAQSGSGYLRPGHQCRGDRFIDRTDAYSGAAPSILIVEGGRNDWARCVDGVLALASNADLEHAVATYLNTLQTHLPSSVRIIVLSPPWGPFQPAHGQRVSRIIRAQALSHGVEFIDLGGALNAARVVDGIHPNRDGSAAIARRVLRSLDAG